MKLLNAFSLQMLSVFPCTVSFVELNFGEGLLELPCETTSLKELESFIGHQDTANVLGVPMNRAFATLNKKEKFIVAQIVGGRLPEGSTTLPAGFLFKFFLGTVS